MSTFNNPLIVAEEDNGPKPSRLDQGCPAKPQAKGYTHPATILEFEAVYRKEYEQEFASCGYWIEWCVRQNDTHGVNFHRGRQSALVFNDIKMHQLLRVLKREHPNAG